LVLHRSAPALISSCCATARFGSAPIEIQRPLSCFSPKICENLGNLWLKIQNLLGGLRCPAFHLIREIRDIRGQNSFFFQNYNPKSLSRLGGDAPIGN